ncbi:hypothetical protein [Vreelandella profundi]|uniref:hypothetical protein n=1 Tax=Vreelandella profundi TaxID=2852117 RepID=UPI001EEFB529|nr:hypothetical protein [Halomonas profundi]
MSLGADDIKTGVAALALLLSVFSYLFTRRSWFESNRPIITAEIKTHSAGNMAIVYSILVHNTGNRPAADILLTTDEQSINKLLAKTSTLSAEKEIRRIFSAAGEIALLHSGNTVSNGFGHTTGDQESPLNYGVKLPIKISYRALSRKKYTTKQNLILKDSEYFAGSGWSEPNA